MVTDFEIGKVSSLFRHPVKSMAAKRLDAAALGWHGIEGDRRLAFRRLVDDGGFPWLTASRLPQLLLYQPLGRQDDTGELVPSHIQTPDGKKFEITAEALEKEISGRYGSGVKLLHISEGIFDEASVSLIAMSTTRSIERELGREIDIRRFRPNIVLDTIAQKPFEEDAWVGKVLEFGNGDGPLIRVTIRDKRCVMINLDPDTAEADPEVMKTVVRMNDNHAGVYGEVVRSGELCVGQVVRLRE